MLLPLVLALLSLSSNVGASIAGESPAETPESWTWIVGELADADRQAAYVAEVEDARRYYAERGEWRGEVVRAEALTGWPTGPAVVCGPLGAFAERGWLLSSTKGASGGALELGGIALEDPTTGVFLRSRDGRRVVLTGASYEGFVSVFSVPTGRFDCTVVVEGSVLYEGDHAAGGLELHPVPFLQRYPTLEDLDGLRNSVGAIRTSAVFANRTGEGPTAPPDDESHAELSEEVLAAFDALTSGKRVLFFGESHWNRGVNHLFGLLFDEALQRVPVRALFLEAPYSYSAHFDEYVHTFDDAAARRFFDTSVRPLVPDDDAFRLLERVRRWNAGNPAAAVHVACVDLEWSYDRSIDHVITPFFRSFDPGFELTQDGGENTDRVNSLLARIEAGEFDVEHPFLDVAYMRNVMRNLYDTIGRNEPVADRCRATVRNITEFHAAYFDDEGDGGDAGVCVFKMGAWHAQRNEPRQAAYFREAEYLDDVFAPTAGRVGRVSIIGIGVRFDEAWPNGATSIRRSPFLRRLVRGYLRDRRLGFAASGDCYLFSPPESVLESLVVLRGLESGEDVLWLRGFDASRLSDPALAQDVSDPLAEFDLAFYVLRSQFVARGPR